MFRKIKNYFDPLPENQKTVGFEANVYIKFLRFLSKFIIRILFLNGNNRFSNEFIQSLNPYASIKYKNKKFIFRTGHGRLFWRVKTFFSEEVLMIKFLNNLKSDDIFCDIGANIGIYSIPASYFVKKTYSFEIDIQNVQLLSENIYLNNLDKKIYIFPFGVAEKNELLDVYFRSFSKGEALNNMREPSPELNNEFKGYIRKQLVLNLDEFIEKNNLEYPTKIKIDVDGSEYLVFKGSTKTIFNCKELYIEINRDITQNEKLIKEIYDLGFNLVEKVSNNNPSHGKIEMFYFSKKI